MTTTQTDAHVQVATNKTLATYYHLFFTRQQRLSSRPEHFAMALVDLLPQRGLSATQETNNATVHGPVEETVAVRILMTRWIRRDEEEGLLRLLQKQDWPIGLLLNFSSPRPQLRRLFRGENHAER